MTEPDDALRDALRDLIPDYTGPVDPLPRVVATVRRRRVRRRTLLAVGGTGLAAVLVLFVPVLVLSPSGGLPAAAPPTADPLIPAPLSVTVAPVSPAPDPPVRPIAAGRIAGAAWAVGSTSLSPGARRCLVSDDDLSMVEVVCFDDWTAGDPVAWSAQHWSDHGPRVTRIAGVAPAGTATVRIRLAARSDPLSVPARLTATDPRARFFGLFLAGTVAVRDVTPLDAAGRALGPPTTEAPYSCIPGPNVGCAGAVSPSRSPSR